jgi:hypothetical protein
MRAAIVSLLLATAAHGGDFQREAQRLREEALFKIRNAPTAALPQRTLFGGKVYPWHHGINATQFWCGESAKSGGGISNARSAYDSAWMAHFGGVDLPSPAARRNFVPASFRPHLNPWYAALPFSDVDSNGHTKRIARQIPWFMERFRRDGLSIMLGTWLECRHGGRVCYLQVGDAGPFRTDSFAYCFGNARPDPNRNGDAGIDLSPAAYQFLGLTDTQSVDWRFCSSANVPIGPWRMYGDVSASRK